MRFLGEKKIVFKSTVGRRTAIIQPIPLQLSWWDGELGERRHFCSNPLPCSSSRLPHRMPPLALMEGTVGHMGLNALLSPGGSPIFAYMLKFSIRIWHVGNPTAPILQEAIEAPGDIGLAHCHPAHSRGRKWTDNTWFSIFSSETSHCHFTVRMRFLQRNSKVQVSSVSNVTNPSFGSFIYPG